jgi:hypothetical protein
MHASRQISRGLLLRAKAAPLQAWLPSILIPGQKTSVFQQSALELHRVAASRLGRLARLLAPRF